MSPNQFSQTRLKILVTVALLSIASSIVAIADDVSLDEETYLKQGPDLGVRLTNNLIKYYNLTQSFEERFNKLIRYEPYEEAMLRVEALIQSTQSLAMNYKGITKLLKNAISREQGRKVFTVLFKKSTELNKLLSETLDFANPATYFLTNPALEKAREEYESMKADLDTMIMNDSGLNEFVDSALLLAKRGMFPESQNVDDKDNPFASDQVDFKVLTELHQLFQESVELQNEVLEIQNEIAEHKSKKKEYLDILVNATEALNNEDIPAFIKENEMALSRIVPITRAKMLNMEKSFRKINLEESVDREQVKLIQKVLDAKAESDALSNVRLEVILLYNEYYDNYDELVMEAKAEELQEQKEQHDEL